MRQSSLQLEIAAEKGGKRHIPFLRENFRRAHALIRGAPQEISVMIVGDQTMSGLHKRFMSVEGPTDVLTFEIERIGKRVIQGEIVICWPEARREARRRKIPVAHELLLYSLHGMLHLSGYDDFSNHEFKEIHEAEDRILVRIGVGRVFAPEV